MKYYLIVGEASGDLHASRLMHALQHEDPEAEFRFFGGDLMTAVGGTRVRHYKDLAYMGFVPVLLHLPTIFRNMKLCKKDIRDWQPDAVILVDYPGFNLSIASDISRRKQRRRREAASEGERTADSPAVYYYISPKIWAWKEYRIKNIKRDVDELFSILPFEVPFFEECHHYPIHYVGNPTAEEVSHFQRTHDETFEAFCERNGLENTRPIIALLAGSRRQEIKDNLPAMVEAAKHFAGEYQLVLAGAPSIDDGYYEPFVAGQPVKLVRNQTYELLSHAHAALVTSGTATLETALFGVPQVVCYETPLPFLIGKLRKMVLKVKYISLVNLIADREVVRELVADTFTVDNIRHELEAVLGGSSRKVMLEGYEEVKRRLGEESAPDNAARIMTGLLAGR
ncbi:MAG: lipid-A-disaccharide synthase [Prevotella sp.]|nr:lipid-A-disaccharide synthase [Prevotella sp.]